MEPEMQLGAASTSSLGGALIEGADERNKRAELASAFFLSILPTFTISCVLVSCGYFTVVFSSTIFFWKLVFAVFIGPIFTVGLTAFDEVFDVYDPRIVQTFRIFIPAAVLFALFWAFAEAHTEVYVLTLVGGLGGAAGLVDFVAAKKVGTVSSTWGLQFYSLAITTGGMLSGLIVFLFGLDPHASQAHFTTYVHANLLTAMLLFFPVVGLHALGVVDYVALQAPRQHPVNPNDAAEATETTGLTGSKDETMTTAYMQFANAFLAFLPLPLLTYVFQPDFAQQIIVHRFFAEFIGACLMFVLPAQLPLWTRGSIIAVRLVLLILFMVQAFTAPALLLALWDTQTMLAAIVRAYNDLASPGNLAVQLRRNRVASALAIIFALGASGAALYSMPEVDVALHKP